VDADTGAPLEGVVVLAYWTRHAPRLVGWAGPAFHDAEEVVTEADGAFAIAGRPSSYAVPLFPRVSGPEWVIFKSGYGRWRFIGSGHGFDEGERVLIALPRLRTTEERVRFIARLAWSPVVPLERAEHLRAARELERQALGVGW
jgi:hypothetical protein